MFAQLFIHRCTPLSLKARNTHLECLLIEDTSHLTKQYLLLISTNNDLERGYQTSNQESSTALYRGLMIAAA